MAGDMEQKRTANVVLTADVDPYRQQVQIAAQDTTRLTDRVDKLTKSLDNLAKAAGKKLVLFGAGSAAGVTAATVAFAAFDKQMTSLKVNAEVTGRSYEKMTRDVNGLRREFGIATSTAAELSRQILGFKDFSTPVSKLAETFVRLGAATGEAPQQLAQGLLQLQRSMGTSQRDTDRYANVLTNLSVRSGVAASSILEFSQAIAPIGRAAGMQQAEIMGVATAFNKAGQDGYYAANAFNSFLSDITQAVQTGSPDLAKYANLIGVTVEQFKGMDKTQAITQVFDELNRLGPNAIQILNRMGLDGMRMQRAIAGVSQQSGGIGTAISQAVSAYNDPNNTSLRAGSEAGMNTLAERVSGLGESSKQFAESIGQNFNGPAKVFISTLEKIVSLGGRFMSSPIGRLAAWAVATAGPLAILTGVMVKFAGSIGALATGRILTANFLTGGFKDAQNVQRAAAAGSMITPLGKFGQAVQGGNANVIARGMYRAGQGIGTVLNPIQPGYGSRLLGAPLWGMRQGLNFLSMAYDPLQPKNIINPAGRLRFLATPNEAARANSVGGRVFSAGYAQFGRTDARLQDWSNRTLGTNFQPRTQPGIFAGVGANAGALPGAAGGFMGNLGRAGVGLGMLGGKMVGQGALMGLRGAAGLGSSVLGALGPVGVAMYGGMAAYGLHRSIDSANSLDGKVGAGADNLSLMSAYKAAVGDATVATQDFAAALHRATVEAAPTTKEQAMIVSEQDKIIAQQQKGYTDKRIKDIDFGQAKTLLAGQIAAGATPADIQSLKIDLIKRFGYDKAEQALNVADSGKSFNMASYAKAMDASSGFGWKNWLGFKGDKSLDSQYQLLEGQFKDAQTAALAQGGSAAGGEVQGVLTNQFLENFFKNYRSKSSGEVSKGNEFINRTLMGGKFDIGDEGNPILGGTLNKAIDFQQFAVNTHAVANAFEKGRIPGLQSFYGQALNSDDKGTREAINTYINNRGLTRKQALAQVKAGKGSLFNDTMDTAKLMMGSSVTAAEATQNRIYATDAGKVFQGNRRAQGAIDAAVASPGDSNAQITAIDAMVRAMKKSEMSYGETERALIQFQAAVGDAKDPLFQLAAGARAVNNQNLQFKLPYMSRADQFGAISSGFANKMVALQPGEGKVLPADAGEQRKAAKAEFEQYKLNTRNQLMAQIQQQREFDIAKKRSNYDFYQVQLPRMEDQFNLSRDRAWEDFNISRQRSEQEFAISRQRSAQQYAISMKDSYADYNTSRKRAEQDFAHQQVLMAKQAAQQMYNIYQRTPVQRTWSAPGLLMNSQDQLERMRQQNQSLAQVRKMGLSKTAIQQLGFTDAANAQQLERFIEDAMRNPALVKKFNQNAKGRLEAGKKLATDPANPQWEEMRRQFNLTMSRGADDFEKAMARNRRNYGISMKQSQEDFSRAMDNNAEDMNRSMSRSADDYDRALGQMKDDYSRQQDRAAKDLKRAQKELTWSFNETLEKAIKTLGGKAKEQAQIIKDFVTDLRNFMADNKIEVIVNWKNSPGLTRFTDPLDRNNGARKSHAAGGLFSGAQNAVLGEAGPEVVLPLNNQGAEFLAALMHRYAGDALRSRTAGKSIPTVSNLTQNYRVDKSTNFTGPVQVSGVENPRELAEKARMEARRKQLTAGKR